MFEKNNRFADCGFSVLHGSAFSSINYLVVREGKEPRHRRKYFTLFYADTIQRPHNTNTTSEFFVAIAYLYSIPPSSSSDLI